ncbi:hypothetical protein NEMIN01_0016, partial [Nematocida minor]|uniref:uncharacterized protein n=1 Tax=Nematocida minor TaxID=1912983 RepID=UPI00221FA629
MDKYSEVQSAVESLKSTVEMSLEKVKDCASGYTMDTIVYKKESIPFPKEIEETAQDEGHAGLIEGVSSVWAANRGKLVIWNYNTHMINEIETKTQKVQAVFAIKPGNDIFTSNVQHCILLFTETSASMMCLCKSPVAYISMDITVDLPVVMTCVCETDDGRVFMGGADGNIYEFVYKESSWLKGYSAKIVSHTHGVMAHILPFLYAMGHKPAIKQMVTTYKGMLVLFEDNTLEAYELKKYLKKIRTADLPELNTKHHIQLVKVDRRSYSAYLILPDATRIFLDDNAYAIGKRPMPSTRIRSRLATHSTIKNERFYQIGKNLVSIGQKDSDPVITIIISNQKDTASPENCCTVIAGAEYTHVAPSGRKHAPNLAESLIVGEEVAFLAPNKVDLYHIMNGVELMERACTNPEGMFAFIQRNGPEQALISALYAVSEGAVSPAIDSLFKKTEGLQKKSISMCAATFIYKIWNVDIYAILKEDIGIDVSEYIEEVDSAIKKTRKLKNFVIRECTSIN